MASDAAPRYLRRKVVMTHSCLLIFSPSGASDHAGQLEFWATLQSLERIRRNLNYPNIVALQWRKVSEEAEPMVTVMKVGETKEQVDEFISSIVQRMQQMGVAYKKNVNKKISENEVSKASIAKMDIGLILSHIENYEAAIDGGDLNISTIQTLTTLYQKGIEYFSALDDVMFSDLLNRMQSLLQRDDIQVILNSVEEAKHTPAPQRKQEQAAEPQPIDFNVSKDDIERHAKQLQEEINEEEESKPQSSALEPPSDLLQPSPTASSAPNSSAPASAPDQQSDE